MIRYILKKDCPAAKAGATLTWDSKLGFYVYDETDSFRHGMYTHRKGEEQADVENNLDWFELIKEEPKEVFTWDDALACEWAGYLEEVLKIGTSTSQIPAILFMWKERHKSKTPPVQSKQDTSKERIEICDIHIGVRNKEDGGIDYIQTEKYKECMVAVEAVLNDKGDGEEHWYWFNQWKELTDTHQKDIENAFNAARERKPLKTFVDPSPGQTQIKYPTLESYLLTLKEK